MIVLREPQAQPCALSAGIAEVYKLESNENLRLILDSMQMPTAEYTEINMDDYSMYTQYHGR